MIILRLMARVQHFEAKTFFDCVNCQNSSSFMGREPESLMASNISAKRDADGFWSIELVFVKPFRIIDGFYHYVPVKFEFNNFLEPGISWTELPLEADGDTEPLVVEVRA